MGRNKYLSDFDKGQIVMARQLGQSISKMERIVGCCYTPSWQWCSLAEGASFSWIMHPATLSGKGWRCCPGLQIFQISIQLSIVGMCWINKFHLATNRNCRTCC